jgi:hypothetical protein
MHLKNRIAGNKPDECRALLALSGKEELGITAGIDSAV